MVDHMWEDINESLPDGCTDIEVMYSDGRICDMCSCDVHWLKELPIYWRYAI